MESEVWVLIPLVATGGFYLMVAMIVWLVVKGRARRAEVQAEVQTRMIDRFANAPEFVTFLTSDAGKKFVSTFEEAPKTHARERILGGVTRSIVLSAIGLAFLVIYALDRFDDIGFAIAGCLLLALGGGYVIATIISIRLSKSWGILPNETENAESRS